MTHFYFSTMRPVSIGTYPKEGMQEFKNFRKRKYIREIEQEAWGILKYDRELTPEECKKYELVEFPEIIEFNELFLNYLELTDKLIELIESTEIF